MMRVTPRQWITQRLLLMAQAKIFSQQLRRRRQQQQQQRIVVIVFVRDFIIV